MIDYPDLHLRWEWLSAPGVKAPELRATWARLEIGVGTETVTLVEDKESGSSRRSIFTSLYPLAEWIAFNWWFLQADTRPATALSKLPGRYDALWKGHGGRYRQRHGMRGSGDGFLWPDLFVLPEGETTRLVWNGDSAPIGHQPIRFLTRGNSSIDSIALQQKLAGFVDAVIERMTEEGVGQTPLSTEWATIQDADNEEIEFCVAAARLGLDPYSEALKYADDIVTSAGELGDQELLRDFLDVVDPDKITTTLNWVSTARSEINGLTSRPSGDVAELRSIAQRVPDWDRLPPWEIGWEQAKLTRQAANVDPNEPFDIEQLITSLVRPAGSLGLQAFGETREGASPLLVLSHRQLDTSRRFTLARAMWHILWQDSPNFLVTSAYTDRQKTERAFAAELLAPAEGISARLVDDSIHSGLEEPVLEELAGHYEVSTILVQHQIENQLVLNG